MQNGMAMTFSWESSAREYLKLYEKAVAEKAAGRRKQAASSRQPFDSAQDRQAEGRRSTTEDKSNKD
jgi:hypothetical protein